ncbi:hypothetical protein [Pseudomonas violetae]|uniref:Uncharacterized protein n=1 Tax=Pseudomonas violetae TaxID=2915813 RepID=A0ABT0ETA5_9PSED|nr:hypothetical protein [Pseudomonas violetae]MCK1788972.1 hypothetical protein [Pseudomonas violetae]
MVQRWFKAVGTARDPPHYFVLCYELRWSIEESAGCFLRSACDHMLSFDHHLMLLLMIGFVKALAKEPRD